MNTIVILIKSFEILVLLLIFIINYLVTVATKPCEEPSDIFQGI